MKRMIALLLAVCALLCLTGCKSSDYKNAVALYESGELDRAREVFASLGDYEDAQDYLKKIDWDKAVALYENGELDQAREAFTALGDYAGAKNYLDKIDKDQYTAAVQLFNAGSYDEAYELFRKVSRYEDSKVYMTAISAPEKLIGEACEAKEGAEIKDLVRTLSSASIEGKSSEVRFDPETRAFACVVEFKLVLNYRTGPVTLKINEGYIGRLDGIKVVIEKQLFVGVEDSVPDFWAEYWK